MVENANSASFANVKIDVVATGRTAGDQTDERVIIQKGAVDLLRDEDRDYFSFFGHLIESVHKRNLVFGKRFLKQRLGLVLQLDEAHFPALHGSLAHQES